MDPSQPIHSGLQIYLNTIHECTVLSLVQNITRSLRPRSEEIKHICMKKGNTSEVMCTSEHILLLLQVKNCNSFGVLASVISLRKSFLIESADKSNSKFNSVIIPVFHSVTKNLLPYSTEFLPLGIIASSLQAFIERHPALLSGSCKAR